MQGINWNILKPVDIGGAYAQGFDRGVELKKEATVRKSLADYANGTDIKTTQNALLAFAPDVAMKLGDFDRERRKQADAESFRAAAGDYYRKAGDIDPADAEFTRMLEIDPVGAMKIKSTLRDQALERIKGVDDAYGFAIQHLGSVTDEAGYQRVLQSVASRLDPLGVDIRSMVPANYPGPVGVRQLLQSAMDAKAQLAALHRGDRLEADIADDQADNARADRATANLIATRNRNAATSERRASAAERRGKNRPGGAKRPTATGPNGEKVQWNGKAWVPVK